MNGFIEIQRKLHQFTRKYYTNEFIKGLILFLSLGAIYFFFTLFLEYFLWLQPTARTVLFWMFIGVEVYLLIRFLLIPIFKLMGLRKGISFEESSKMIGNHFPEVEDKLLNILQLEQQITQSDLLLASIEQKSVELQPIPFIKAVDFKKNIPYLKYVLIPFFIYLISLFTISNDSLKQTFTRVVNHRTAYVPPAPFVFFLENKTLEVIQGEDLKVVVNTQGNVVPSEAKIKYNNQEYYLQNERNGFFSYLFSDVQKPITFSVVANEVQSQWYTINVIQTPNIQSIELTIEYPKYINKSDDVIANATNITVPEGTNITWKLKTKSTDSVVFINKKTKEFFSNTNDNVFEYHKKINDAISYQIASSNQNLKEYERLPFSIAVVKDEFPQILVTSNIDSISRGTAEFAGQLSDDYGLKKLELVYYNREIPEKVTVFQLPITNENVQTFFYQFPDGLTLAEGVDYEMYFQVFDNDGVNGNKKSKSKVFTYRTKTEDEIEEELLQEQRNTINSLENSLQKQQKQQEQLENIQQELQKKKDINWNDKKKIETFLKRQEQYKQMMQRQTEKLEENLDEKQEKEEGLQEKKEDLKERIKELKQLEKQQKLLDEIQKMADKLNKEELVEKAKELAQQNRQQQRSLEKMLEMVKRFYVEQKAMQIANKINELSKKQENLAKEEASLEEQNKIKNEFNEIKKELDELTKDNEQLKEPMDLPDVDENKNEVDKELKNAEQSLKEQNSEKAKQNQNQSSKKMKEMSAKMQQQLMEMQGDSMEENMDDLRKILENLVIFSFEQEQLMNRFDEISTTHPDFGKSLKKQNEIKTYFEHIDDSLYMLSMRVPKISTKIQNDLATAHYNLDQSLENFSENRFDVGISNQRYVMTSTNNLADYLSTILNDMKNNMSMKMGKGKKGKGNGFSLPDLIKKQQGLSEKLKEGMQKGDQKGKGEKGDKSNNSDGKNGENGKKQGNGEGNSEDSNGELFEIFKQQSLLRQELENAIKESDDGKPGSNANAKKALKTMEELENEILEKGFTQGTLQKMQNLNYELLKLDKAALEQGEDKNRKSNTNQNEFEKKSIKALQFKKQFYNQIEILNRQSLPLQQNYKKKVRAYFSETKKEYK